MRICMINWRDLRHPWAGGTEVHLDECARELSKRGHTVTLLCGGYKGLPRQETIDGIRIIRIGGTYSIYLLAPCAFWFFCRKKTDIVMEASHGLPFFARLWSLKKTVCIIYHIHGRVFERELSGLTGRFCSWIERSIVPFFYRSKNILTISASCAGTLGSWGYKNCTTIVPGVSQKFVQTALCHSPNRTILVLGRIRSYKRIHLVISLLPRILLSLPDVRLIIAGDGPARRSLTELVHSLRLEECVRFEGLVSEQRKLELYRTSRVLAFPSEWEGWGLVSTEAAASGLPTVAFRVPGLSESVKEGQSGLLANSLTEFQNALVNILRNDALHGHLSSGARAWAKEHSWERAGDQLETLLREIGKDREHLVR